MANQTYGGSTALKPSQAQRYTKADRDTILRKYRKLQDIHAKEHANLKAERELLRGLQWSYPPADALKTTKDRTAWWAGSRCPTCFCEYPNHMDGCELRAALNEV